MSTLLIDPPVNHFSLCADIERWLVKLDEMRTAYTEAGPRASVDTCITDAKGYLAHAMNLDAMMEEKCPTSGQPRRSYAAKLA